ncbi:helix-turn-helix domain-containing protein [Cribrihabitans neustonicus]|uniref:AraC-like ligand-binding domain-containing protein n=1 Tax=Cribrihabitans neustonicus TaxID=1429085 RepID=UPI003B5BA0B7
MDARYPTSTAEPLRVWRRFHSRDIGEARAMVARKFCDHALIPAGRGAGFDTRHNHAPGRSLSLNFLSYGAEVQIAPEELRDFYLVQLPIAGHAEVANGSAAVASRRRIGTVLNPDRKSRMTWHADCRMLLLQISRKALHHTAERAAGMELPEAVAFDTAVPVAGGLQDWVRQFAACVTATSQQEGFGAWSALQQHAIEEQLMLGFLSRQMSNIRHLLDRPAPQAGNAQIRRAQEFIHAHLADPISLSAIASAAGCSLRSLQTGFRGSFGLSPMQYLRDRRLDMAHYLLLSRPAGGKACGNAGGSVGSIAHDCGFAHMGRFAQLYRARFGQPPSATARAQGQPRDVSTGTPESAGSGAFSV